MKISRWGGLALALALCSGLPARGTAQAVDSVQIRLRESLRRLERAPAPDTAAMTAADSAAKSWFACPAAKYLDAGSSPA